MCHWFPCGKYSICLVDVSVFLLSLSVYRLLHLAIIHEAKDYIRMMIDLSRDTDFLNIHNDQRQVCGSRL